MRFLVAAILLFSFSSCGVQYHFASTDKTKIDTSYIYTLPYPKGTSHFLIQGYNSKFSHRGRLGLDFKMQKGSTVTAARNGIVMGLNESFTNGGWSKSYLRKGNYVIIRHNDGTQAYYGHLLHNGVLVDVGDTVQQGQIIAKSGTTGYSATPHLHFIVWGPTPSGRKQLPTRFNTSKGVKYLKPGHWYKAV
ncbi:MAG: M23 family metallopeptidase [Chitinophagaceae bacterium]|nr:M23 family metallopeptidase [Chitinophagaceae bacterium]